MFIIPPICIQSHHPKCSCRQYACKYHVYWHLLIASCLELILSFNKNEEDTDTVFTALSIIEDKNLMPFAIDSFGNYICLDLSKDNVVFWDHETDDVFSTGKNIESFIFPFHL